LVVLRLLNIGFFKRFIIRIAVLRVFLLLLLLDLLDLLSLFVSCAHIRIL